MYLLISDDLQEWSHFSWDLLLRSQFCRRKGLKVWNGLNGFIHWRPARPHWTASSTYQSALDTFSTSTHLLRLVSGTAGDGWWWARVMSALLAKLGTLSLYRAGCGTDWTRNCRCTVSIVRGRVWPMAPVCHHHRWPVVFGARRECKRMQSGVHVTSESKPWYNNLAFRTDKSNEQRFFWGDAEI